MAWRLRFAVAAAVLVVCLAAESESSAIEEEGVGQGGDRGIAELPADARQSPSPSPSVEGGNQGEDNSIADLQASSPSLGASSDRSRAELQHGEMPSPSLEGDGQGRDNSIAELHATSPTPAASSDPGHAKPQLSPSPSPALEGDGQDRDDRIADLQTSSPSPAVSADPSVAEPRHGPSPSPSVKARARAHSTGRSEVPAYFRYQEHPNKMCSGVSYTSDQSVGCNGWGGLSEVQCQEKCSQNSKAPNCPQKQCLAAVFFSASGWCHLYEPAECQSQNDTPYALTYKKVKKGIFDNPVTDEIKETMQNPVAHEILEAGGIAAGIGVAAAGVEAALHTRDQPKPIPSVAPWIAATPVPVARSPTTLVPGDTKAQGRQQASGAPGGISIAKGAPALSSSVASPLSPTAPTSTTTTMGAAGSLSSPGSGSGLLLWLPLLAVLCGCLAMALPLCVSRGKKSRAGFERTHSEDDDEDYKSEDYDVEDGLN